MSDKTDPGIDKYQIRPFSKDWPDEIERLWNEVAAVRDQVSPFYLAPADAADTAAEGKVAAQVAPYGLDENDRHETIRGAAATVGEQIQDFATSRKNMGRNYMWSAPVITQKLEGVMITGMQAAVSDFGNYLRDIADRLAHVTEGETRKELQDFKKSQPIDSMTQKLIGQYALFCGLAGRMIDAGNAFLNLNAELRAALEFYAEGRAPQGWRNRLPAPVRSIFSESTWTAIDESVRIAAEHGLAGALGPFSAIPVAGTRIVLAIREDRVREERKFRRDDVDELLDLADQVTKANDEANRLESSIDAIVLAARSGG